MQSMYSIQMPHIHSTRIVRHDIMTELNAEQDAKGAILTPEFANNNYNNTAIKRGRKSTIALGIIIVIILAGIIITLHSYVPHNASTSTISTISVANNSTTSTTPTSPRIGKIFEPVTYLAANAFISNYSFSSPLKYSFRTVFKPYSTNANCTGMEGILGYMQNQTMISTAYNLSKLNRAQPIAEYAAVEGINPSNAAGYNALFESNGGFCRPSMSLVMSESSVSKSKYAYDNITVYFFGISNMSANATEQFGSYLGPKPNMTVYMAEAMYGNYIIKATSAGFSPDVGALNLISYTKNVENATINAFESYIADHPNATG